MFRQSLLAAAFALVASTALAATPPKVSIASTAQLKTPLPYPYDEKADADAVVAQAKAAAKAQHKLLLLDLGGNWCGDCRVLAGVIELPEVKAFLDKHYVVAKVDVGQFDRNLQIPARYGLTRRLDGVPTLLVIDPATDRLIDKGHVFALDNAGTMTPQSLADFLAMWVK